ncbi:hypothetical protein DAPPUDRAFT_105503 [Daphnia pulex]|uniref:Secreted protein n=1 Tax=Daphnia pulex TaxID=6669 RepID=E9GQ30_DAPPU|nr:hypothetical protein DAPPUDRAFT_105503 [Daphnia pulex]|eukprot:EFX78246.1 hypothetical protein DAPPUDRAFT_105503 [Daphnia pulex]
MAQYLPSRAAVFFLAAVLLFYSGPATSAGNRVPKPQNGKVNIGCPGTSSPKRKVSNQNSSRRDSAQRQGFVFSSISLIVCSINNLLFALSCLLSAVWRFVGQSVTAASISILLTPSKKITNGPEL